MDYFILPMKNSRYKRRTALFSQNVLLCTSIACNKYLNAALDNNIMSSVYSNPNTNCTEGPLSSVVVYASCTKYMSLKVKIVKSTALKMETIFYFIHNNKNIK